MGLDSFVKNNSRFVKFENGVTLIMDIISYKESTDMNGNDAMSYKVVLLDEQKEKILQSGSVGLARQIMALPDEGQGHRVKITRTGEGFNTTYKVELSEIDLGDNPAYESNL